MFIVQYKKAIVGGTAFDGRQYLTEFNGIHVGLKTRPKVNGSGHGSKGPGYNGLLQAKEGGITSIVLFNDIIGINEHAVLFPVDEAIFQVRLVDRIDCHMGVDQDELDVLRDLVVTGPVIAPCHHIVDQFGHGFIGGGEYSVMVPDRIPGIYIFPPGELFVDIESHILEVQVIEGRHVKTFLGPWLLEGFLLILVEKREKIYGIQVSFIGGYSAVLDQLFSILQGFYHLVYPVDESIFRKVVFRVQFGTAVIDLTRLIGPLEVKLVIRAVQLGNVHILIKEYGQVLP